MLARNHHGATESLQHPRRGQRDHIAAQPAEDRTEGEHRDGGTEDSATAEPIRRPTAERNEHREAQEIGGDGHAEPHWIGMQRYRHLRQRRGDDGGVDLLHDDRRRDDDGDEFWFCLGGHVARWGPCSVEN